MQKFKISIIPDKFDYTIHSVEEASNVKSVEINTINYLLFKLNSENGIIPEDIEIFQAASLKTDLVHSDPVIEDMPSVEEKPSINREGDSSVEKPTENIDPVEDESSKNITVQKDFPEGEPVIEVENPDIVEETISDKKDNEITTDSKKAVPNESSQGDITQSNIPEGELVIVVENPDIVEEAIPDKKDNEITTDSKKAVPGESSQGNITQSNFPEGEPVIEVENSDIVEEAIPDEKTTEFTPDTKEPVDDKKTEEPIIAVERPDAEEKPKNPFARIVTWFTKKPSIADSISIEATNVKTQEINNEAEPKKELSDN